MKKRNVSILLCFTLTFFFLNGCVQSVPKEALQLSPENLKNRQIQSRWFDTDEKSLLAASAAVLQDLGFTLEESETDLGVVVCSKRRDAKDAGQIVGAILLAALTGAMMPTDTEQLIRASLVTCPMSTQDTEKKQTRARITFQRIVSTTDANVKRRECINDEEIYQEFFEKLSKSLFLEANNI